MTDVMPMMAPVLTNMPNQASCGWASRATATGASTLSLLNGTMPVITADIATYRMEEISSAPRMPIGRSRCGLRASSAVVEAVSKPTYEKKMMAAPCSTPLQPKWPKVPALGGTYGCKLEESTYFSPARMKITMIPTFSDTMKVFAPADCDTPM